MASAFSISRWTDAELLCVLQHCKGNFVIAIEIVLRHDATGRPPCDLIRYMSEIGLESYSGHARTYESPVAFRANDRMNIKSPQYTTHASELSSFHNIAMSEQQESQSSPEVVKGALSRFLALDNSVELNASEMDKILIQVLSRARARQYVVQTRPTAASLRHEPRKQELSPQEIDMLSLQIGIASSLKDATSTSKSDLDTEAISYAVKASMNTFNEEFRKNDLRNALEMEVTKMACFKSSVDINRTEEELITKAMIESLSKPMIKSEEPLVEDAKTNCPRDPIIKSEEELVATAMCNKVPKRGTELVASTKRRSLNTLGWSAGEITIWGEDASCRRWSLTGDKENTSVSKCSVDIEPSPSIQDSDFDPRKMPAQIPQEIQFIGNNEPYSSINISSTARDTSSAMVDYIRDEENREEEYMRSIIVEEAGFSLVNGVYKEHKSSSTNMFTRSLDLDNGVVATASVYLAFAQDHINKEWILSITSSDYSPGSGMDVILYSARVCCNEELPTSSTKWTGVSHIVRDGPPPKVTELLC